VVFPTRRDVKRRRFSLHDAQYVAATALVQLHQHETPALLPMDGAVVYRCEEWLERNEVDLPKAVVSMIHLAA
jgi:hypothetical protein